MIIVFQQFTYTRHVPTRPLLPKYSKNLFSLYYIFSDFFFCFYQKQWTYRHIICKYNSTYVLLRMILSDTLGPLHKDAELVHAPLSRDITEPEKTKGQH